MGNCVICGKPSGYFPLCKEHNTEKEDGKIIKCEECKTWHYIDQPCKCEPKPVPKSLKKDDQNPNISTSICVVCGEPSNGKPQCKSCYEETIDYIDTLNKSSDAHEFRDYYYNLKDRILIMKDIDVAQKNCNKLIAIALTNSKFCNDTALVDRVYKDVETLISKKKPLPEDNKYKEERRENDEDKTKIHTAQDGHKLQSHMEMIIDDMLYNANILHCYEKTVDEIIEARKKCDWFIPILSCNKGIYIEYWGKKTDQYMKDRAEKEKLYRKYNVPYIGIEKDDPRESQLFKSNLIREIRKLAIERYTFMPEWK